MSNYFEKPFRDEVEAELGRARTKFPERRMILLAWMEELGEAARAVRQANMPRRTELQSLSMQLEQQEEIRTELVQVGAMTERAATEGDAVFDGEDDLMAPVTLAMLAALDHLGEAARRIMECQPHLAKVELALLAEEAASIKSSL